MASTGASVPSRGPYHQANGGGGVGAAAAPHWGDDAAAAAPPGDSDHWAVAQLAAEMPAEVEAKKEFALRVRLSRKPLAATPGAVHQEVMVTVAADELVVVEVIGKTNCDVVGDDSGRTVLPTGDGINELPFTLVARAPGPVRVVVLVRQGDTQVPLATLTLTGTVLGAGEKPGRQAVFAEVHTGVEAPELGDLPCLDIIEREVSDDVVVYHYAVRLEPGKPVVRFASGEIKDRVETIATILDDVEAVCRRTEHSPGERLRSLQDIGTTLYDAFVPPDMQAHLWRHRAKLKDLIVYADEPFVPWELVHLKPPNGPRQTKPRFLAQGGMVRWQLGSFPPREITVRADRARALVPAYKDPRYSLPETAQEKLFLTERFGAVDVKATPTGVRSLLRSGDFDLLHFAGHGAADPEDIADAKILLQGRKRAGTVEPEYAGATMVRQNAAWAAKGTTGPVVVLNACQVGRSGELLSTVGGFAKAFLDAGASAFVSCLWSVQDTPSRLFVERLYDELLGRHAHGPGQRPRPRRGARLG